MGLLLSVLVTCVGVVELVAFYHNVRRRAISYEPVQTSLATIHTRQIKELEGIRDRLSDQYDQLRSKQVLPPRPTVRLNSHEDIEIEFCSNVRSRSPSPRRFLVSEQSQGQRVQKSKTQECVPEYLIEEVENAECSIPRYLLKDGNEPVPLPLPETFLVSERNLEIEPKTDNIFRRKLGHSVVELDGELYYRRSPSPFPSFDLTVPRNSICSELLDGPVSVAEIDEPRSGSTSPVNNIDQTSEKVEIILNQSSWAHSSSEYWENKKLVVPIRKSKSRSASPHVTETIERRRSYSESHTLKTEDPLISKTSSNLELSSRAEHDASSSETDAEDLDAKLYSEEMKNSLDGLDKSKGGVKKKLIRKKRVRRSHSKNSADSQGAKVGEGNNSLNSDVRKQTGSGTGQKPGDPFWLIFSGEYTKAMNKDWHGQHFCCWQCDESLTGQRYVLRDEHPYCVSCYESVFANACEKCSRTIGIDSKDLSYKDKHWHEACFLCTTCGESLVDKQFGSKGDRIYCGRCYDEQFASRCDGCHEIFRAGTKKMEYKTRQWHEKCFCCCVCKVPIGTQSFIPREQEIYCAKCYEDKYATRCIKCNKVITSGGVTYKNEPWHRECFTCTHCQKSLAGERFTSRDEKPYCADCFGELFAKRCFACNKPITGIGGTKFISFEDRHWHNDCFFCASCRTSLVGRGFITDNEDIICPDCAKQKLV
ncbi:paxillin isoform X1 [Euwallacea fornicatus]|uniref:paxillin isoform X1 n=1 Tax=Euwallacea fornicatus TaxID=995702 RepID=UPI00338DDDA1